MKLIIQEYTGRELYSRQEREVSSFEEASIALVHILWSTASVDYSASVLRKWFGGPPMVGDEKPFDVREYDGPPGNWTDYLFRL